MARTNKIEDNFFSNICDLEVIQKEALQAFCGGTCGELFLEYREDEVLRIENGAVQIPSFDFKQGFGLRTFVDDSTRYSYSSALDIDAVKKAIKIVNSSNNSVTESIYAKNINIAENKNNLYDRARFIETVSLDRKIDFLKAIDAYARTKSPLIKQVFAVLASSWQVVDIINDAAQQFFDIRPLVRLTVSVVMEKNGVMESGMSSFGGRFGYDSVIDDDVRINHVNEAVRQASIKLEAGKAPVGEMPVVLGNGWTGILLHEAIGHGLEGDAIRKKTSSFHNLLGSQIAAHNVTVVDDGSIENRRGSINIDDEGISSRRNVLIENGKLVGFLQDRMNARLMGVNITGNGRREGYHTVPIPRMTNTFMVAGDKCVEEMICSVKNGLFAKSFSDGQVDTTSGKFVFSASEAYLIENGKIGRPVKGAMLIGDGPSILTKISMVGSDFSMDPGVGTCGKDGQWVPVGVGQPSVLIDTITVGGADL